MIQNKSLIFDLEQERTPAFIRIYGTLKSLNWPLFSTQYTSSVYEIFRGVYDDKLPCNVILYGRKHLLKIDGLNVVLVKKIRILSVI